MAKQAGKGSGRRPRLVSEEEYSLRWDLAAGRITLEEFDRRMYKLQKQGKVWRK